MDANCNGNGYCDSDGTCQCVSTYEGRACDQPVCSIVPYNSTTGINTSSTTSTTNSDPVEGGANKIVISLVSLLAVLLLSL